MTVKAETFGRAVMARLARAGMWTSMGLLALMAGLIITQVVARNFFDKGLPWADELARFSSVSLVFLTIPLLALRRDMVSVTMLPDMVGPNLRRWMHLIGELALLAFAIALLFGFSAYLPRAGKFSTPAMGMPNWIFYGPALIGTLVLTAAALLRIFETLTNTPPLDAEDTLK
ncbi:MULTISPECIES: TRAP transporter small permease subunit [Rhodobacterales]|uniref:TRAP transporter small permease n=1 Tax=Roseobacter sp. N2S TaxID=2663844 RepID=UPI002869F490|nr:MULTISPECIES: TRAP transporter small permease subunit [Rhodobacterales]